MEIVPEADLGVWATNPEFHEPSSDVDTSHVPSNI